MPWVKKTTSNIIRPIKKKMKMKMIKEIKTTTSDTKLLL